MILIYGVDQGGGAPDYPRCELCGGLWFEHDGPEDLPPTWDLCTCDVAESPPNRALVFAGLVLALVMLATILVVALRP